MTITYDSQGGSSVTNGSTSTGGSISAAPTAPTKSGFSFNGWFVANTGGSAITFPYTHGQTANFNLYAQWTADVATYTVTFNGNTSTGGSTAAQTASSSTALTTNGFTKTGHTFAGWNTAANGSGTAYAAGANYAFSADVTLYAQWTATAVTAPSSSGYSAAEAAAIRAANEAAAKAETEKLAAAKAVADAKAVAEAAAKAAADKAALEKVAAERAVADKIAAEERAVVEAAVKAEEAKVAAAVAKAAASDVKVSSSKSGTKLTLDLADKYYGKIVTVYVGTKKNGKVTYRAIDFFAVDKEDGTATISTKMKLAKGQIIRVNVGKTVVKSLTLK